MFEVYYKNQLVTEYIDTDSLDYNDLLNNWKVKFNNVLYDCYIKASRYYHDNNNGLNSGFYYLLSVHDYPEIFFEVKTDNDITLKLYTFKDDVYFSDDFDKITFIEKTNYIDVVSDCLDMSNILECISQNVKSNSQYYFDKYSNPVVSFPPVPYKNLYFKVNNISNFLDVYLHSIFYSGGDAFHEFVQMEKCCSFRILQTSFFTDFFKGIVACIKENQCNISSKNSVPVVVGGAGQYYTKAEIDLKLNEIKMLIRNISTLPEGSSSSVLTLDTRQFKALSSLLLLGGK